MRGQFQLAVPAGAANLRLGVLGRPLPGIPRASSANPMASSLKLRFRSPLQYRLSGIPVASSGIPVASSSKLSVAVTLAPCLKSLWFTFRISYFGRCCFPHPFNKKHQRRHYYHNELTRLNGKPMHVKEKL